MGGGIVEEAISGTTDIAGRIAISVADNEAVLGAKITSIGGITGIYGVTQGGNKYLLLVYVSGSQIVPYVSQDVSGYVIKLKI